MSENISVSDEAYDRRKREKGDRSFSEVIAETPDARTRLAEAYGAGVPDEAAYESS